MSTTQILLKISAVLLCICLYSTCSDQPTEPVTSVATDDFQSYPMDVKAKGQKMTKVIASIELMLLEETDVSLISDIILPLKYKDMYAFVANKDYDIMFYDEQGNFIRKFNRLGQGPEEYNSILNLWIEGDVIGLLDGYGRSVKSYSMEGEFLSSASLPSFASHIYPINDQYLLQTNHTPYQDSLHYEWVLTDKSFSPVDTYLPFNFPLVFEGAFPANYISPYKSGLVFYSMFTDSIHLLKDHNFSPLAHLDFGDEWYWRDKINPTSKQFNDVQFSDKAWDLDVFVSSDFILGRTPLGFQSEFNFLIDRHTGLISYLDKREPLSEHYTMDLEMVDDDRFLFSLSPDEVTSFLSELDESQIKYRQGTTLEKIELQENPVFMWVTFKQAD